MDLLLVRLAGSPRPSAKALRAALLAQPWLVLQDSSDPPERKRLKQELASLRVGEPPASG